jgi:O-antigen biosynthesis protein
LEARLPTPIQNQLINDYLCQHAGGPRLGILILDLLGDAQQLMKTIRSLGLEQGLYATLKIIALTTADAPLTKPDAKLHFVSVKPENYVAAINEVARTADFDWLMLVDAGEEFTPSGLMMAALDLVESDGCRAVYGDELQRTANGALGAAFRPGFNLDMLLSFPTVMARHWLFRREIFVEAGGFNARFASALEFEILLRLIERGGMAGFGHVDEPLLITTAPTLIDSADEQAALLAHLQRRGYTEARLLPSLPGRYRIRYGHREQPLVSIIVPTKDQLPILQRCVESLLEKTAYANYELLIVDNASETAEARAWLAGVEQMGEDKVRVLRYPHPFNYSAINNMAAREARGEYLVLLNNDTAIISETWLDELLNHALRPEVGITGAKLLYPDGKIQHAGVVLGLRGPADHPFIGESMNAPGYMQRLEVDQNYSAVTAACLMIRKSIYEAVGGLDEQRFKVSYNDVDLCLKVREAGHLIVWTPHSVVMHEGSVSQKRIEPKAAEAKRKRFADEQDAMYEKWLPALACDPAYNRNLSLNGRGFDLEPDVQLTWRPLVWKPLPVVLAHPADPWGCGNYRVIQPFKVLREQGKVDGMLSYGLLHAVDLQRYDPDVLILQRQIGDDRLEAMRRAKAFSRAFTVYELDDYLPNLPMKSVHRERMPKDILRSLRRGLSYVDRFVVSTDAMAEAFSGLHNDIFVASNCLPEEWWRGLSSQRRRGQKPRVGWAGGISHSGDLSLIVDVVKELASEVDWVFLGMCPKEIRPYVKESLDGVDIELYPQALARLDLDLALAPVEQNLFNECKSNLRLLEYGACGFPVICSDVRCYQGDLPVTRVKNRFKDWVDAIRMHINDLDAAAAHGDELRARVLGEWMLDGKNLDRWREAWLPS